MKILTILGTRPEIIRLSRVIPLLDRYADHFVLHTGQNYDKTLLGIFFKDLRLRQPDLILDTKANTPFEQIGKILLGAEKVMLKFKPDRLLLLGDTNSSLVSIVAKRLGIKVLHVEAGNRCYDDRVPEEVNRRVIDHSSDILMPYTERSRANLIREGIAGEKIFVVGNPIKEILDYYEPQINQSKIMEELGISSKKFFLSTLHREENVDSSERLAQFLKAFNLLVKKYKIPLIWSVHPRTRKRLDKFGKGKIDGGIHMITPVGLFDFVRLEKNAACILSDSGTVQEEGCIFGIPTVTLRDATERPETLEVGGNFLSGSDPSLILKGVRVVMESKKLWLPPREYMVENVSETIVKISLSYFK